MTQTGRVLNFLRARPQDWTQQELAEFYRVESALLQSGLLVTTDRGLSDEGDPWFVFCTSESEEVIAHFARIDGQYLVVSSAFSGIARGRDFKLLIRELMQTHPLMLPRNDKGQNVYLHPGALLAALVAASYVVSADKDAAIQVVSPEGHEKGSGWFQFGHDFALLSAVMLAAVWIENQAESTFKLFEDLALLHDTSSEAHSHESLAPDTSHAAGVDAGVLGLLDAGLAPQQIDSDPTHSVVFEASRDTSEAIFSPPHLSLTASIQSTGNSNPSASADMDGIAANHADTVKDAYTDTNGDPLARSVQGPEIDFAADHGHLEVSNIIASSSTSLHASLLTSTEVGGVQATNQTGFNQQDLHLAANSYPAQLASDDVSVSASSPLEHSLVQNPATSTMSTATSTVTTASAANSSDFMDSGQQPFMFADLPQFQMSLQQLMHMHANPYQIESILAILDMVPTSSMPLMSSGFAGTAPSTQMSATPDMVPTSSMPLTSSDFAATAPSTQMPATLHMVPTSSMPLMSSGFAATAPSTQMPVTVPLTSPDPSTQIPDATVPKLVTTHVADTAPPATIIGISADAAHHDAAYHPVG
jgi:hypothetical protein